VYAMVRSPRFQRDDGKARPISSQTDPLCQPGKTHWLMCCPDWGVRCLVGKGFPVKGLRVARHFSTVRRTEHRSNSLGTPRGFYSTNLAEEFQGI